MHLLKNKGYNYSSFISLYLIVLFLLNFICFGYPDDQAEFLERKIKKKTEKIEEDKRALNNLGFKSTIKDIEEWINMSEEAKKEFENILVDELINISLLGIKKGTKSIGSIGTGQGNEIIGSLKRMGIDMPLLNKAIYNVAHVKGKPEKAKAFLELIEYLEKARDLYKIDKDEPKQLKNFATVLGWLLKDPRLNIIVSGADVFVASVYNIKATIIIKNNIKRLTELTEDQLKAQKKIIEILTKHVKELEYMRYLNFSLKELQREDEMLKSEQYQLEIEKQNLNSLIREHDENCDSSPQCMKKAQELRALKEKFFKKRSDLNNRDEYLKKRKIELNKEISEILYK